MDETWEAGCKGPHGMLDSYKLFSNTVLFGLNSSVGFLIISICMPIFSLPDSDFIPLKVAQKQL